MRSSTLLACLLVASAIADESPQEQLVKAQELEAKGKLEEALQIYLAIPGAEHSAAKLAKGDPARFLAGALSAAAATGHPRTILVRGDVLRAKGDQPGALRCYRQFVAAIGKGAGPGWAQGAVPFDYYPVEPPRLDEEGPRYGISGVAAPFTLGAGSHRDNWLVRRFVALQAWEDVAAELSRISALHQAHAGAGQFDGLGLQFAIDHAFFLKQRSDEKAARQALLTPLLKVDLDRNPNLATGHPWGGNWRGSSRKEFIRLAYGFFKDSGHESELVEALTSAVDHGSNPARRVLARVRLHQGKAEEASALEVAYLRAAKLDPLTAAYRLGLAYEDLKQLSQAAAQYERVLALPFTAPNLPDRDEEEAQTQMMAARVRLESSLSQSALQSDVLERLTRLYTALGDTDKALAVSLRQLEANDSLLQQAYQIERIAQLFKGAGKEAQFKEWAHRRAAKLIDPETRANLLWAAQEEEGAVAAVAQSVKSGRQLDVGMWKERLVSLGKKPLLAKLLQAQLAANPQDAPTRLELLDQLEVLEGPEVIAHLELLLQADERTLFATGHLGGRPNRTRFHSEYDLAYRLLRLYERAGQADRLASLGLRIARLEKPFTAIEDERSSADENGARELANACLALAIERASPQALETLASALEKSPWTGARAQCHRRLAGGLPASTAKAFGWAGVPKDVALLSSNENVLDLARDERHLFAGQPWGVAVYDLEGNPVTRVPLQTAGYHLAVSKDSLWVGTPVGVYRVDPKSWAVAYLPCDQDIEPRQRTADDRDFQNGVTGLAIQGEILWIGTRRNVRAFNITTSELRIYTQEQLGAASHGDWRRFVFDGRDVWAEGELGCRRLDPQTGRWRTPASPSETNPVHLLGVVDGTIWGEVELNNELRWRPCTIDRQTLKAEPALIDSKAHEAYAERFHLLGQQQSALVFASGARAFRFNPASHRLSPLSEAEAQQLQVEVPGAHWTAGWSRRSDGVWEREAAAAVSLPGGAWALGETRPTSPRYIYSTEDWPLGPMAHETPDGVGGLRIVAPAGKPRGSFTQSHSDSLLGDSVFFVLREETRVWLGTERGLSVLDDQGRVVANLTRADGLLANRVVSAASLGGRTYFGCGWGDDGGGVMVWDPKTSVFTSIQEADGLASNNVAALATDGKELKITYGVEYERYTHGEYKLEPPGGYAPATGRVSHSGAPRTLSQSDAYALARKPLEPVPFLGGFVLSRTKIGARTYLAGTRGLLIFEGDRPPRQSFGSVDFKLATDLEARQLAELRTMVIPNPITADQLRPLLASQNPYVVAEALAATLGPVSQRCSQCGDYAPLVATVVAHPFDRVRTTAVYLLTKLEGPQAAAALRRALSDSDAQVRAAAALSLTERGEVVALALVEEIFRHDRSFGNLPFGATSTIGVVASGQKAYEALAPHATPAVFELLLKYPPRVVDYDHRTKVFPQLGESLRKDQRGVGVLLEASTESARDFARAVFGAAGAAVLPKLHEALVSKDRVVRANAALGCGAIGDRGSTPKLIQALDLESGLSRGAIVWALGELRAEEALPQLARLYLDARNDETRRAGAGYRVSQALSVQADQYQALSHVEAVGKEWNELQASSAPPPLRPERDERLLTPRDVLEAVRKIGPGMAQEFYRTLAGEKDSEARAAAARALVEGDESDRQKNLPILLGLLSDADSSVRIGAAVSLLILDQATARQPVLDWLGGQNPWEKELVIRELQRSANDKLAFARKALLECAGDKKLSPETREAARLLAQ